jgi:hypothetical protein
VEQPYLAVSEMHRVLRPHGIAIVSSVFEFPIHNYPDDYWRFTPAAFRLLLKEFTQADVFSFGRDPVWPQSVVGIGFKDSEPERDAFLRESRQWERWNSAVVRKLLKDQKSR